MQKFELTRDLIEKLRDWKFSGRLNSVDFSPGGKGPDIEIVGNLSETENEFLTDQAFEWLYQFPFATSFMPMVSEGELYFCIAFEYDYKDNDDCSLPFEDLCKAVTPLIQDEIEEEIDFESLLLSTEIEWEDSNVKIYNYALEYAGDKEYQLTQNQNVKELIVEFLTSWIKTGSAYVEDGTIFLSVDYSDVFRYNSSWSESVEVVAI